MAVLKSTNINGDLKVNNGNIFGNIEGEITSYSDKDSSNPIITFKQENSIFGCLGMNNCGRLLRYANDNCVYKIYDESSTIPVSNGGTGNNLSGDCGFVISNGSCLYACCPSYGWNKVLVYNYGSLTTCSLGSAAFCSASSIKPTCVECSGSAFAIRTSESCFDCFSFGMNTNGGLNFWWSSNYPGRKYVISNPVVNVKYKFWYCCWGEISYGSGVCSWVCNCVEGGKNVTINFSSGSKLLVSDDSSRKWYVYSVDWANYYHVSNGEFFNII